MKTHPALLCLLLVGSAGAQVTTPTPAPAPAAPAASVESFTPEGYTRGVRQVQVRFAQDMVALGDPRLPDPFVVTCDAAGHGRWADTRNWEYDFDADLEAGVSCRFTLQPRLKSLAGIRISGRRRFEFNTGGPAIRSSLPHDGWEEISEDQVFIVKLDALATTASITEHAWCAIDGVVERVPVQVVEGAERTAILSQSRLLAYSYYQLLWKDGRITDAGVRNHELTRRETLLTLLRCQRRLPPATQVTLHWGTGILTPSGLATHEDQQLAFRVRPEFTATVECTRTNPRAGCVPTLPIQVSFSAPVPRALALRVTLIATDGKVFTPTVEANTGAPSLQVVSFRGPFAESRPLSVQLPAQLVDDAGRTLANAARFPLTLGVDRGPPLVKFSGEFGILEAREGGVLPVTLRNVEPRLTVQRVDLPAKMLKVQADAPTILEWLSRVEQSQASRGEWTDSGDSTPGHPRRIWQETTGATSVFDTAEKTSSFTLKAPGGARPIQVVGIPLRKPGLYVVEIASPLLGAALLGPGQVRHVATSALVTDLAVHLQWGDEASTVWVTQLSTAKPVPEAEVVVANACSGATLWQGRTDAQGLARIARPLGLAANGQYNCRWLPGLIALAHAGSDSSFTLSNWTRGITPSDFSLPVGYHSSNQIYHTVFDRELFHAGEVVSMKHFIRRHVLNGMDIPAAAHGTLKVEIIHAGSGDRYSQDVDFDDQGIASSEFQIPAEARLGTYYVSIDRHGSGTFTVAQFRLPSMRGAINGPAHTLVNAKSVDLALHVEYLSGGGAAGLPVKIRSLIEPQALFFAAWPGYTFGGDPVQTGLHSRDGTPFDVDADADDDAEVPPDGAEATARAQTLPLTLDGSGSARLTLKHLPKSEQPARLTAEMEYSDANGQTYTASTQVALAPASIALGLKSESWIGSPDQLRFQVLAVDLAGKVLVGQEIHVHLYRAANYSYRKRLIGGFYAYASTTDTKLLAPQCAGSTDSHGLLLCNVAPGVTGQILVRAETKSPEGVLTGATTTLWCLGADELWFGGTSGDRMDLLPEKTEYSTGDVARFQVRMPFRAATALVSVEREGVIRSFVTTLHGNAPLVEVPIEAVDSPNVFVSVLAVRGRVAGGSKDVTALVDLTRPAYRLGMAQIKVNWKPHRLLVQVEPAASVMKVRQTAQVHIHVSADDGAPLPAGTEVAVAAVDEALLNLKDNDSWNLLAAMMQQRPLQVWTSTGQMQVVGKRHYGRKAVPHGGGGGREQDPARELFDSLLVWKPRVSLDANGDAVVQVPLNDSLSAFRIVAVAHAGEQKFGTGSATLRTTQDLILLSGLPPLVRGSDHFTATFTVRNTTDHEIAAKITVSSAALTPHDQRQSLQIAAGLSTAVHLAAVAPVAQRSLPWTITVRADAGDAHDSLKITQQLSEAFPVRTYQATLTQLTQPLSLPTAPPQGAIAGRGGLNLTVQDHLAGSLDGVREYMSSYPYICLEQRASKAVALDNRAEWDSVMRMLPLYMDADGLLRYFPSEWLPGDDTLTAYLLAIGDARGWPLADESRERMVRGLKDFVAGRIIRYSALPTADLAIRKLAAIEALSRYHQATPDMLDSLAVQPELLPTSALLDWIGILQRLPQLPDADQRIARGFQILKVRLNFQGTIMTFSTEREDALWWLMISEDSNANRLLLAAMTQPLWRADVPRLVRGALGRQQFGHWNTTVANAWGVLAMEQFSARFESTAVTGSTRIRYGSAKRDIQWSLAPPADAGRIVDLPWAAGAGTLTVEQAGSGAPWIMVRAMAALPLTAALSSGYKITKTVTAIDRQHPDRWTRGDVLRIHLQLQAQSDMSWVVVEDPVPAGATILGSGLGGESALLRQGSRGSGAAWLAFQETRFDSFRAYYRFVPKGQWTVEYTVRLDNPGTFILPATRVEAMYAPEMFGEVPNAKVTVAPQEGAL
ncbi:MAG TPA: MG2 domain-containing protein [Steroidobacteraceae bacterium]|nr:MG2 domain-containing protein [Steroidobacteraceae bacterium]